MSEEIRVSAQLRAGLIGAAVAAGLGLAGCIGTAVAVADPVLPVLPVDPALPLPVPPEPAPNVPPAAPPVAAPPPGPTALLSQVGQALQSNPVAAMNGLLAASPQPALVGQGPLPPGAVAGAPAANPLADIQMLRPQNFRMPTPDQASPYALAPNDTPSPFARIDAWKGVHAMVHSNLGRMPGSELGQALPGTAPPPGTNLPPGLEQFYVDPAAPTPAPPPGPVAGPPPALPVPPPADPLLLPVLPPA